MSKKSDGDVRELSEEECRRFCIKEFGADYENAFASEEDEELDELLQMITGVTSEELEWDAMNDRKIDPDKEAPLGSCEDGIYLKTGGHYVR